MIYLLKLLQSYYQTSRQFTVPFDLECNFCKNVIRNGSELCSCIYLILQYALKKACLSLNPVVLFFYLVVWFRERISSD